MESTKTAVQGTTLLARAAMGWQDCATGLVRTPMTFQGGFADFGSHVIDRVTDQYSTRLGPPSCSPPV